MTKQMKTIDQLVTWVVRTSPAAYIEIDKQKEAKTNHLRSVGLSSQRAHTHGREKKAPITVHVNCLMLLIWRDVCSSSRTFC